MCRRPVVVYRLPLHGVGRCWLEGDVRFTAACRHVVVVGAMATGMCGVSLLCQSGVGRRRGVRVDLLVRRLFRVPCFVLTNNPSLPLS